MVCDLLDTSLCNLASTTISMEKQLMATHSSHQIFYGDEVLERLRNEPGPAAPLLASLMVTCAVWRHRRRTRRQLAQLDDAGLRDIGLARDRALREARKPFWRA
jgi:uncharacterized protein YjiS (DUF1127 family)